MSNVVIASAGSGRHACVVAEACRAAGIAVAGWIATRGDLSPPAPDIPLVGDRRRLGDAEFLAEFVIALGSGNEATRRALATQIVQHGGSLATVIHPASIVSSSATIGAGTVLLAASVVGTFARIGSFCIVNTAATVDHDNVLEDGTNLCPGAHLAGNVSCGEDAFIGIGAVIIPGVHIGARAIIGAGATVIRDVPDGVTVVGCPARPVHISRILHQN